MAFLLLMPEKDCSSLSTALKKLSPDLDLRIWPEVGNKQDIDYVVVWNHPAGSLKEYPHLKVVASYGAGVDHIFRDPELPKNIAITRLADHCLLQQMADYCAGVIMAHKLRLIDYREYQAAGYWSPKAPRTGNDVCLLGLGHIGQYVAHYLSKLGFNISGWSQSPKSLENVNSFHGKAELKEAVRGADYIICLLPLTPATENILNKGFFAQVKKGTYLVNAGRGGHLNEDDLLDALYEGQLGGATLDVFKTEPLPADHTFWRHPKINITPHCASLTDVTEAAVQLLENYRNMKDKRPLINQVNPAKGY